MTNPDYPSWTIEDPPEDAQSEDFDLWCFAMVRVKGYAPHLVASRCCEPASLVAGAVRRVECGRYGSPFDLFGVRGLK